VGGKNLHGKGRHGRAGNLLAGVGTVQPGQNAVYKIVKGLGKASLVLFGKQNNIMEYLLIFILQILGIGFHVMQKIISIGDKHPEKNRSQIFSAFLYEDWDTLAVSLLVIATHLIAHYIVANYTDLSMTSDKYILWSFSLALLLGYAGQRLAYKFLGSAEEFLNKKVSDKLK
jgi:hypothetical protein